MNTPTPLRRRREFAGRATRPASPLLAIFALAPVILCAACARDSTTGQAEPTAPGAALIEIASPASAGSAEPRLSLGADGRLYLSWIEPRGTDGHALLFSYLRSQGWSEPRTVATGEDWFVNWADFPSLTANADGVLAAHWLVRSADETYAYDVVLATSGDSGLTWTEPVRPHRDGTPTEHGFVSVVPAPDGRFDVIWLDGRKAADDPPGPMSIRHARLDVDGSVSPPTVIDPSVCDCCPTEARRTPDGTLLLAYRARTAEEIRDIRVATFDGAEWSAPRLLHADGWEIAGCPVNGPAVAVGGELTAIAWYTEAGEDGASVLVAFSEDGGNSFHPPIVVDTDDPLGRVDLTLEGNGRGWVSWLGRREGEAAILIRGISPEGFTGTETVVARTSVSRSSGYPQMNHHDGETIFAWTETSEPSHVRTGKLSSQGRDSSDEP